MRTAIGSKSPPKRHIPDVILNDVTEVSIESLTSDITGAGRLHRAASVLMDGLGTESGKRMSPASARSNVAGAKLVIALGCCGANSTHACSNDVPTSIRSNSSRKNLLNPSAFRFSVSTRFADFWPGSAADFCVASDELGDASTIIVAPVSCATCRSPAGTSIPASVPSSRRCA